MSLSAAARPYDIVVWGASGFTGRLVCEHIARDYQGKVRWAIAGRDRAKLEQIRQSLQQINPACKEVPILTADAKDAAAVGSVLKQTSVVLATAGPFSKHGDNVVEQSVEQGTHYCDITGEVHWVKRNIERHHAAAEAKGVRIVHCCGYDSVPSDLGALMMVEHCRDKLGKCVSQVYTLVGSGSGGISGGTVASAAEVVSMNSMSELKAMGTDQYYLAAVHGKRGSDRPAPSRPTWNPYAKTWTAPFLMEGVNARIVQLSNALAPPQRPYGADFKYCETLAAGGGLSAALVSAGMGLIGLAFVVPPLRSAITRWIPPGSGPSEQQRVNGHWTHKLVAVTEGPNPQVVFGECGDRRDPGYWSTSRMLLEAGLTMVRDADKLSASGLRQGGVLTPASALGMVMVERLRGAGFTFRVDEAATTSA